jgi:hypothetical protein
MKRSLLIIIVLSSLYADAQKWIKGVGVFGSVTSNKHSYKNPDTGKKITDTAYVREHFYPQTHISKEFINWGAGIFLEISGREDIRWQTELEYINKGAKEMPFGPPGFDYTGDRTGSYGTNKLTYIQWNNYLKFYYPIFASAHWYFMAGVRLEYLFKNSPTVFADAVASFPKFWFSGDLGLGYEFPLAKRLSAFTEYHWNPDIITHKYLTTNIRARTHELRVGLVLRPRKRRIDDCNAPVYKGPAY